jgi:predicted DNA-binding protein
MTTKPALQKILKGVLSTEEKVRVSQKMQERINSLTKQTSKQGIGEK